jgi:hypothetical protein
MVHVVVKHVNMWDLMTFSNTSEWKTYITKALAGRRSFTYFLRLHTKAQAAPVIAEEEEQSKGQVEGRANEGEEEEPEGVAEVTTDMALEEETETIAEGRAHERIPAPVEQMERENEEAVMVWRR